jgi:branched-chain amino acid transport system ATP-binding protein
MAIQAAAGHSFRFCGRARADESLRAPARALLAQVGIGEGAAPVSNLSHGERRQVELAMVLAGQPRMLLLDEPMAGTGPAESRRLTGILRGLKGRLTILLVEHDMDVVFALADRITVLVRGQALATGAPGEIRANAAVQAAYLGDY